MEYLCPILLHGGNKPGFLIFISYIYFLYFPAVGNRQSMGVFSFLKYHLKLFSEVLPLSSLSIFWPEKVFLLTWKALHASRRLDFGQWALQQIMQCKQMSKITWKETQLVLVPLCPHNMLFTLALDRPCEHWQADTSKAFLLRTFDKVCRTC